MTYRKCLAYINGMLIVWYLINFLSKDIFLDPSNLKEFEDDNFKFDKIGQKFSKQVENIVGIGEINCLILPFSQCF